LLRLLIGSTEGRISTADAGRVVCAAAAIRCRRKAR
jgi:hypothetical protein